MTATASAVTNQENSGFLHTHFDEFMVAPLRLPVKSGWPLSPLRTLQERRQRPQWQRREFSVTIR